MGAWGYGPFDDDTAMDFIDGLADRPSAEVLPILLAAVERLTVPANAEDYRLAVEGIAAAALLAGDTPRQEMTSRWGIPAPDPDVASMALEAIDVAYGDGSVLVELAFEAGSVSRRIAALGPVRQRLQAAIPAPQSETLF